MTTVGVVGLGTMGGPMAACMVKAGLRVVGFDVHEQARAALASVGGEPVGSLAELAELAEQVHVVVVDDAQLQSVVLGQEGLLGQLRAGSVIVIHSTVTPATCVALAKVAQGAGIDVLDAPVGGAPMAAAAGTLTLMIGGDSVVVERCKEAFDAIASHVFHLGGIGTGEVAKIANNLMGFIALQGTFEGLALAAGYGIDEQMMLKVAALSSGDSWAARSWNALRAANAEAVASGAAGLVSLSHKDMALALNLGRQAGTELPVAAVVAERLERPFLPGTSAPADSR
jgi:3-hydroxyisobutyrate dehydrogenase